MDISLVMFKSDGTRRDFPLTKSHTVVGRKRSCDLRIPLTSVSRQHCEIALEDDGAARLRDLGSSNGTYHNSTRVQQADLAAGDEIVIGPVVFIVVIDGVPDEIHPVRTILNGGDGGDPHASVALAHSGAPPQHEDPSEGAHDADAESEDHPPTVDLDDPIAALEAMADADLDGPSEADESDATAGPDADELTGGDQDSTASNDDDFDIELLTLDDETDKPGN